MLRLYTVMNKTDRWARSCQRAKQSQPDGLEGHEVFYWREVTIVLWMLRNKANLPCRTDGGHGPPYGTEEDFQIMSGWYCRSLERNEGYLARRRRDAGSSNILPSSFFSASWRLCER